MGRSEASCAAMRGEQHGVVFDDKITALRMTIFLHQRHCGVQSSY